MKIQIIQIAAGAIFSATLMGASAQATVVYDNLDESFANSPATFTVDGGTFTFSGTGDIFNPTAVQTSSNAEVSSFGGFLGIPVEPTTDFINRGTVTYGPGQSFSPFTSSTTVPYSNGDNFFGLEVVQGGQDYFGFAYTTDTTLNSYGFETVPGQAIIATTAVPEPETWVLMIAGFGLLGWMLRYAPGGRGKSRRWKSEGAC